MTLAAELIARGARFVLNCSETGAGVFVTQDASANNFDFEFSEQHVNDAAARTVVGLVPSDNPNRAFSYPAGSGFMLTSPGGIMPDSDRVSFFCRAATVAGAAGPRFISNSGNDNYMVATIESGGARRVRVIINHGAEKTIFSDGVGAGATVFNWPDTDAAAHTIQYAWNSTTGRARLWVDGLLTHDEIFAGAPFAPVTAATQIHIGRSPSGDRVWAGVIDIPAWFADVELDDADAAALHAAAIAPNEVSIVDIVAPAATGFTLDAAIARNTFVNVDVEFEHLDGDGEILPPTTSGATAGISIGSITEIANVDPLRSTWRFRVDVDAAAPLGAGSFQIDASDQGGGSDSATIAFTVIAAPVDPPTIDAITSPADTNFILDAAIAPGATVNIDVAVSDPTGVADIASLVADTVDDALTIVAIVPLAPIDGDTAAFRVTVTVAIPAPNGAATFRLVATDLGGGIGTQTITLMIAAPGNTAPIAFDAAIAPRVAVPGGTLTATYTYSDGDGDAEVSAERVIRWYRRSAAAPGAGFVHIAAHDGALAIAPNLVVGDRWRFELRVSDGTSLSALATSETCDVGAAATIRVIIDDGAETQTIAAALAPRGVRRSVRLALEPRMIGKNVEIECEATAATRLFGFGLEHVVRSRNLP